jgi:flagellar motility protein MotE (MotC chaperone)
VDIDTIELLRERSPAWRLLRANHAPLVLSFLGAWFVDGNRGPTPASELAAALEDHLHVVNEGRAEEQRFSQGATGYLETWADTERGWLRRFYPVGSDEVHYDATPAVEKTLGLLVELRGRPFVGTASRLETVVDLLRQMVHGAEEDPAVRRAELERRRFEIDQQIADIDAGRVVVMEGSALRDRYQLFASSARELLSDFREVEENFRLLDRAARERIAAWQGSKGELLEDLVGSRTDIAASDQGRSFQAFYDFLLSPARQDELTGLLDAVERLPSLDADRRLRTVHHGWFDAAERTQQTVRQLSEQLRRFLDDQVWLENRRVLDLVRGIEVAALAVRETPPSVGLELDVPGLPIVLPFERPLHTPSQRDVLDSTVVSAVEVDLDATALFEQTFVDQARLAEHVRAVVPRRGAVALEEILDLYPVTQGLAELVGYLALTDEDIEVSFDEGEQVRLNVGHEDGRTRDVLLPQVGVHRR